MNSAEAMYSETILHYYRSPPNKEKLVQADAAARDLNPACGDVIEIQLQLVNDKVTKAAFNGSGCAISQAAASMLCEFLEGKTLEEVVQIGQGKMLEMLGIEVSPMRLKCALLGFKVAKMAAVEKLGAKP